MPYSISDLEQLSGIKAHTIRMWEQRHGILRPERTATNIRTYSDADLRRLLTVAALCGEGRRISQIAKLSETELGQALLAGAADAHDYNSQVNALLVALLAFDELRLHELLNGAAHRLGFEEMMMYVAYPLLQRIGLMWLAGTLNPAQEHLLAHLLRQKMLAATEALPPVPTTAPRWLLFLPEGELHEIALLFMNLALRRRGQHTLYLGQNMPLADLAAVCTTYQPYAVTTVLTTQPERGRLAEFAAELAAFCPCQRLVLYGSLARQEGVVWPAHCERPVLMTDFLDSVTA